MYYITVRLPTSYHQMSFEDFLNGIDGKSSVINPKEDCTRTFEVEEISDNFRKRYPPTARLIYILHRFNEYYAELKMKPREGLYTSFKRPKKNGKLRQIDAPNEELSGALNSLKSIFEVDFGALYHTNAFAYITKRSTIDCVKKHQRNESNWFAKYDLSNFFGSTTLEYVMKMLGMIFPFSEVIADPTGRVELESALELAFLHGGLPQGTPISPMITNLIMIPVDYIMSQKLRHYHKQEFIYTRYADDFFISSVYTFNFREIEKLLSDTMAAFGAPFKLNSEKTRYGSRAGQNFMLGVCLNKDNQITVGYKKKKEFKNLMSQYAKDKLAGNQWDLDDVQHIEGLRSYYRMVEGITIDNMMEFLSNKFGIDIVAMIKHDLQHA